MKKMMLVLPVLILLCACSSGYRPFSAAEGVDYTLYPAELDGFDAPERRQITRDEARKYGRKELHWPYSAFVDRPPGRPADGYYSLNFYTFDEGPYSSTVTGER